MTKSANNEKRLPALPTRRILRFFQLAIPIAALGLLDLGFDLARRWELLRALPAKSQAIYVASSLCSLLVASTLTFCAATGSRGRRIFWHVILVAYAVLAIGGQSYTFARYHAYMDDRAVLLGTSMLPSIGQQIASDAESFASSLGPPVLLALLLPFLLAALRPPAATSLRRGARDLLLVTLTALAFHGIKADSQQSTPSALYVHAMGQFCRAQWDANETVLRVHPGRRKPAPVPPLTPAPAVPRNVLFVLTESVRADQVCLEHTESCAVTPFTNQAAPGRIPLFTMRSLASTTAISIATMWSGLPPEVSREDAHAAPLLWEYAKAAGLDAAYYTSQNLLFGNSGKWLEGVPFTRHVGATHLEPDPTLEVGADDHLLVKHTLGDLDQLREPWLSVVHLSNTHYPYGIASDDAPFQPQTLRTGPSFAAELLNRYRDAIWHQDRAIAELVRGVRARPEGERTVIVFLSDHGEQMHEHGAHGHTGTLFESEIRIPAWIDAPPAALTDQERSRLEALRRTPLTTLDVFPTVMDLLGLWKNQPLGRYEEKIPGESLLRGGSPADRTHVLSNCTGLWACAFRNWGVMQGSRKLFATQASRGWLCFDLASDPEENSPLPIERCADLLPLAEQQGRPF